MVACIRTQTIYAINFIENIHEQNQIKPSAYHKDIISEIKGDLNSKFQTNQSLSLRLLKTEVLCFQNNFSGPDNFPDANEKLREVTGIRRRLC